MEFVQVCDTLIKRNFGNKELLEIFQENSDNSFSKTVLDCIALMELCDKNDGENLSTEEYAFDFNNI